MRSLIHTLLKPTPQFLQTPALERKVALMNIAIIKKTKELFLKLLVLLCGIARLKVKRPNVNVCLKIKSWLQSKIQRWYLEKAFWSTAVV